MYRKFFFLIIVVFSSITLFPINIEGYVRDAQTGEPLVGASIYLKSDKVNGTTTGLDGSFALKNLKSGKVSIVCSYISYKTLEKEISIPVSGVQKIYLDLVSYEQELSDVVVTANNKTSDVSVRNIERLSSNVMNVVGARSIKISPDLTLAITYWGAFRVLPWSVIAQAKLSMLYCAVWTNAIILRW